MTRERELDLMDGFNLYNTDEELQPDSSSRWARRCLLFVLAAMLFIGGVWTVDAILDKMDAPSSARDENIAQLKAETSQLEDRLEKFFSGHHPAGCEGRKRDIYFERSVPPGRLDSSPRPLLDCFSSDMDLGVSGLADPELEGGVGFASFERACAPVLSLRQPQILDDRGETVRCDGDLTSSLETNLPTEIHETHEWTSATDQKILLELWGGGGGGAGSIDAWHGLVMSLQ